MTIKNNKHFKTIMMLKKIIKNKNYDIYILFY